MINNLKRCIHTSKTGRIYLCYFHQFGYNQDGKSVAIVEDYTTGKIHLVECNTIQFISN